MAEMKNICGKIPMDLHEKVREEIELTESSTQKFLQQVIEEHFNRLEGKGEISMGAVRTVAVQVSEELFQRLKVVIGKKHNRKKALSRKGTANQKRKANQMERANRKRKTNWMEREN